jgi:predicted ATP-binding protein involved in virulence
MSNESIPQPKAQTPPAAYFLSLSIANFRCFKEEQTLDLSDGNGKPAMWTILLGENGTGKTSILQDICTYAGLLDIPSAILSKIRAKSSKAKIQNNALIMEWSVENMPLFNGVDCMFIVGYGPSRMNKGPDNHWLASVTNCLTLILEDAFLIDPNVWLLKMDHARRINPSDPHVRSVDAIINSLTSIFPDVTGHRFRTNNEGEAIFEIKSPYGWVQISDLSLGYRSAINWISDLIKMMYSYYPNSPNPLAEAAVCLVDEIDLHMHPKWQRELIKMLSETFPKTQFIVTAHSPLIVQAAPDANVALLRREGDHVVIENGWEKARNWRVDQIFASDLFDAGALSEEVRDALRRRRELAQKAGRTEADEVELSSLNAKLDALPSEAGAEDATVDEILRYAEVLLQKP